MGKRVIMSESQFDKLILKEYLDKYHAMPLWKYFNMSEEEKEEDIVYYGWDQAAYFLDEWVRKHGYEEDYGLSELGLTQQDYEEIIQLVENQDQDFLCDEIINGRFKGMKGQFSQYLSDYYYYENSGNGPSWLHMDNPRMIRNKWLIHFSNNAANIAWKGFKHGTTEFEDLAYSNAGETSGKYEGYDFAYDLDDFQSYCYTGRGYHPTPKYGKEAVIFRASGVKLWHYGDNEDQVIFYGPSAKDIIYLEFNDETDEWHISSTKRYGQILYQNENLGEVVDWIERNYDQYRKHLISYRKHKDYENNYNKY